MEIQGFTKVVWKKGNDNINLQLNNASKLFYECEYKSVLEGQRLATTDHISLDNLDILLSKLTKDGLVFTPCKKSGFYQGFAHKHKAVEPGKPYYWFGCITKTIEDGIKFKEAEDMGDHETMGTLLGYPSCCVKYFKDTFHTNYDPVWLNDDSISNGKAVANNLLRYFGVRVISHFSCSPGCKKSIKVGNERLEIMKSIDQDTVNWLLDFLSTSMTWNSYKGVVEVDTTNFLGLTHTYPLIDKPRIFKWN